MFAQSVVEYGALAAKGGLERVTSSMQELITDPNFLPWLLGAGLVILVVLMLSRRSPRA